MVQNLAISYYIKEVIMATHESHIGVFFKAKVITRVGFTVEAKMTDYAQRKRSHSPFIINSCLAVSPSVFVGIIAFWRWFASSTTAWLRASTLYDMGTIGLTVI